MMRMPFRASSSRSPPATPAPVAAAANAELEPAPGTCVARTKDMIYAEMNQVETSTFMSDARKRRRFSELEAELDAMEAQDSGAESAFA